MYYIRLGLCFDNGSLIDDDVDDDGRLYSAVLRSRADSLRSHVILHE